MPSSRCGAQFTATGSTASGCDRQAEFAGRVKCVSATRQELVRHHEVPPETPDPTPRHGRRARPPFRNGAPTVKHKIPVHERPQGPNLATLFRHRRQEGAALTPGAALAFGPEPRVAWFAGATARAVGTVVPREVLVQEVAEGLLGAGKLARTGQHQAALTVERARAWNPGTKSCDPVGQDRRPATRSP